MLRVTTGCVQVGYIHLYAFAHEIGVNCCCICIRCMTQLCLSFFIKYIMSICGKKNRSVCVYVVMRATKLLGSRSWNIAILLVYCILRKSTFVLCNNLKMEILPTSCHLWLNSLYVLLIFFLLPELVLFCQRKIMMAFHFGKSIFCFVNPWLFFLGK